MEITGGLAGNQATTAAGTERATAAGPVAAGIAAAGTERALAAGVAAGVERLIGLFRSLSPPDGLSLTAAATLATLERSGRGGSPRSLSRRA